MLVVTTKITENCVFILRSKYKQTAGRALALNKQQEEPLLPPLLLLEKKTPNKAYNPKDHKDLISNSVTCTEQKVPQIKPKVQHNLCLTCCSF